MLFSAFAAFCSASTVSTPRSKSPTILSVPTRLRFVKVTAGIPLDPYAIACIALLSARPDRYASLPTSPSKSLLWCPRTNWLCRYYCPHYSHLALRKQLFLPGVINRASSAWARLVQVFSSPPFPLQLLRLLSSFKHYSPSVMCADAHLVLPKYLPQLTATHNLDSQSMCPVRNCAKLPALSSVVVPYVATTAPSV